jgi:hypothetical protein
MTPEMANYGRYRPGRTQGHYESFFLRANHPTRPLAFWIRYTMVSPRGAPERAIGELWAIYFDGEAGRHTVAKTEVPAGSWRFAPDTFQVEIGDARLAPGTMRGAAESAGHRLSWDLSFRGDEPPLFHFPIRLYETALPKAKTLVGLPFAVFRGALEVDGVRLEIDDWVGSQNHNWGSKHTDEYAWAQVAGFDDAPTTFLEVAAARIKLGPLHTPWMTPLVLRHRGEEIRLNSIWQCVRAKRSFEYFRWGFACHNGDIAIEGTVEAPREAFVGLAYANPPGGVKHCLNSKIASCTLSIRRKGAAVETVSTKHRAAFEILTDDRAHGVAIRA